MKSHLIPEPKPIERHLSNSDAARMYLLDQIFSNGEPRSKAKKGSDEEYYRAPEMPMRGFLQVVFVR